MRAAARPLRSKTVKLALIDVREQLDPERSVAPKVLSTTGSRLNVAPSRRRPSTSPRHDPGRHGSSPAARARLAGRLHEARSRSNEVVSGAAQTFSTAPARVRN